MFSRFIPTKSPDKAVVKTPSTTNKDQPTRVPDAHVQEHENQYTLDVNLPGVTPELANVSVTDGVLTIRGTLGVKQQSDMNLVHREYEMLDFSRSFSLPKDINVSDIQATSKNGVLHVRLPKAAALQPRKINVTSCN